MAKAKGHLDPNNKKFHHKKVMGSTEGGQCLTKCYSENYRMNKIPANNRSCCYRWQAYERLKDIKKLYEKRIDALIASGKYRGKPGFPVATKDWMPDTGENYTHSLLPFYNNAHHLIPASTLRNTMLELESTGGNSGLFEVLWKSLFAAGYNINHKFNMLILPCGFEVGEALRLPLHKMIAGKTGAPSVLPRNEIWNHAGYNRTITVELGKIIADYYTQCKACKDKNGHVIPNTTLSRASLETLSKRAFGWCVGQGTLTPGQAISQLQLTKNAKGNTVIKE